MKYLHKLRTRLGKSSSKAPVITDNLKKAQYEKAMYVIQNELQYLDTDLEKGMFIDYAIKVIGEDLAWSTAARLLYYGETPKDISYTIPTSHEAYVGKGNFSLSSLNVVIDTYDLEKIRKALPSVRIKGFRQEMNNYTGTLYPEINMVIIENGRHHLSVAVTEGSGSAKLQICSLKKSFSTLTTDGAYWYLPNMTPDTVHDCRMAILYGLAKMKHELCIPDDLTLTDMELPIADRYDPTTIRNEAYYHTKILELELKIKKYQLQLLQGEKKAETISTEMEMLKNISADIQKDFRSWIELINSVK